MSHHKSARDLIREVAAQGRDQLLHLARQHA